MIILKLNLFFFFFLRMKLVILLSNVILNNENQGADLDLLEGKIDLILCVKFTLHYANEEN